MSYHRTPRSDIPSVPTFNGFGAGQPPTQRITDWNIPVRSPFDGVGIWPFDDDSSSDVGEEGPLQVDQTAPPTFCPDGSVAIVSNGVSYCPPAPAPAPTPAATPPAVTPPKTTPTPAAVPPAVVPPPASSSGGLSTTTLIVGGLVTAAAVGGLVYWKKKKGRR